MFRCSSVIFLYLVLTNGVSCGELDQQTEKSSFTETQGGMLSKPNVNLAFVICGNRKNRQEEALTMLKSVVAFSHKRANLNVFIVADEVARSGLQGQIEDFQKDCQSINWGFNYRFVETWLPDCEPVNILKSKSWRELGWAPCMNQRLFFPTILPDVDSVVYLDIDTLLLSDMSHLWNYFSQMSENQIMAMSKHSEQPYAGHYYCSSGIPFHGPTGLDSGVILMNLTRMRSFNFEQKITKLRNEYDDFQLFLPDQDLLNILFSSHKERVFVLPCDTNFNCGHCDLDEPRQYCHSAESEGVSILHGTGRSFFNDQAPFMKPIYQTIRQWNPVKSGMSNLLSKLKEEFQQFKSPCFAMNDIGFYKRFKNYVNERN